MHRRLAVRFRFTPQEESGAFGRRILLPPPLRGCPQGRPGEDPRTPSLHARLGLEPGISQSSDNQTVIKVLVPNLPEKEEVWNRSFCNHLYIIDL